MKKILLKAAYLVDTLSVKCTGWSKLGGSPIRLSANELEAQVKIAESAKKLRRSLAFGKVIPDVSNAEETKRWNDAMLQLLGLEKWDKAGDFLFRWWKKMIRRYPMCPDIFQMMRQSKIGRNAEEWAKVFPVEVLLKNRAYGLLLRFGYTEALVNSGHADYVIENFEKLQIAGCSQNADRGRYVKYALPVEVEHMKAYLNGDPRKFAFFTMHPLGLQVLADCGFSGAIAALEKQFMPIGINFPEEFKIVPQAHRKYIELVNSQLETSFKVPDE